MTKEPVDRIHRDADGQFAKGNPDRMNNGVASAKPRVITHSDDATIHNKPPAPQKSSPAKQSDGGEQR